MRLGGIELRREVLFRDLGGILEAGILPFRSRQIGLRVLDVDHILTIVDVDQRLTRLDELIVGDVERDDIARDLRRDRHRVSVNEGVVRIFVIAIGEPVFIAREAEAADKRQKHDPGRSGGGSFWLPAAAPSVSGAGAAFAGAPCVEPSSATGRSVSERDLAMSVHRSVRGGVNHLTRICPRRIR